MEAPKVDEFFNFIIRISPEFKIPFHLRAWCIAICDCLAGGVRAICAVPIRHHKSETTYHGIAFLLNKDPKLRFIVMVADHEMANVRGKRIRQLCEAANVGPERGQNTILSWMNSEGGGVTIMSAKQSKLGLDCDVLVFDDPLSELDADDFNVRQSVDMAIAHYTARSGRTGGKRGSVLGIMSPWHPDDPIGRRKSRQAAQWMYIQSPAIINWGMPDEIAFAEDVIPLEELRLRYLELHEADPTDRIWWAQFMCDPRPMGTDQFRDPTYYAKLPEYNYRKAFGVDFAYTVGDDADYFARVVGRVYATKLYILEVIRHKIDAHLIESVCKADMAKHGRAPFFSYMSGPEIGMANVLRNRGVPIMYMRARYNKLVRAQNTIKRWNDGDILIPDDNSPLWAGFRHRLSSFRGHEKDSNDDEADALVSLHDGLMGSALGNSPKTVGKSYGGMSVR